MIELLSTKLFIPRPRKNLVSRPRLVERLNAGLDKKLTLIAAPAGFGKTTLLSEWIPQSPRCVTWVSLDESDNDPSWFWAYFVASLQALRSELGKSALHLLQSPQVPPITSILTILINDITVFPDTFAIVLDDYHVIESQSIQEGLIFLIDHLPDNMHLIITTRVDPPLPIARLRARNQLNEIRANDLRLSAKEAAAFLTQVMGLNLSAEEVTALEVRTEGWIAGLQIAALSMQGHDDVSGFVRSFSGSHRHILGYLAEEVIKRQPEGTQNFLLQTSILERLCGELCNAVTEEPGGQAMLENLEHVNLFVVPLDDEGKWYRYHHLFAEVLHARLHQSQPDKIQDLHRRASAWCEQNGGLSEAVNHALAAQDFDQASRLIEQTSRTMWQRGDVRTLRTWLDALPPGIRRARPRLCLAQAWSALAVGQIIAVESSVLEAEAALSLLPETEANPLRAQVVALQSALAGYRQDSAQAIELAHQALTLLPEDDHILRGHLAHTLGRAYLTRGDLPAANQKLREASTSSLLAGDLSTASLALSALGAELEAQGQLREAATCYQQAIQSIQKDGRTLPVAAASGAYGWLGRILYEWNQLDEAAQCAKQCLELSRPFNTSGGMFIGYLVQANILMARNDVSGAANSLENAETTVHSETMLLKTSLRMVEAVRVHLWLAQRNFSDAAQWAANYESNLDFPVSGDWPGIRQLGPMFDFECLTLIRVRMEHAQWGEALRLLMHLQSVVESGTRKGSLIKILVLRALVFKTQEKHAESSAVLERSLILAEPEGYIRIFVDEGEPMRHLLLDYRKVIIKQIGEGVNGESLRLLPYTDKLLAAFPQPVPVEKSKTGTMPEPLSDRELEILQLIATGHSNQEIADNLVIALSTVKSHINNLYGKLGTNRRTQAISIARELRLFDEERNV